MVMATRNLGIQLTAEQQAEAQRIKGILMKSVEEEVELMAQLMTSKANRDLLGETEFEVRDIVHRIGAKAVETVVNERKKGVPGC
jgi:hypothetical protein